MNGNECGPLEETFNSLENDMKNAVNYEWSDLFYLPSIKTDILVPKKLGRILVQKYVFLANAKDMSLNNF